MVAADLAKPRRIELILRQIDSLPTLPAVATRLLTLTASDTSCAREVVEAVSCDPTLTARILSLCRAADKGVRSDVVTLERAVVLLGFGAVRNAVLSVQVLDFFKGRDDDGGAADDGFDRSGFWTHCLAVGIMAELIARGHPAERDLVPDEAFVCGLLHDLGKLALDRVLPKAFARVVQLIDLNRGNIAECERRVLGIDHHTAGKRLAEQWRLPHVLQDCIWLHGAGYETTPRLEHRRMIGLVSLADQIARRQHVGYSGNYTFSHDEDELIEKLGLQRPVVDRAIEQLHEHLEQRSAALGLDQAPSREHYLRSIQQANAALGRLNRDLDSRSRTAGVQAQMLETISRFHAAAVPGRSVQDVLDGVAASAAGSFGPGFYALLLPGGPARPAEDGWLMCRYTAEGQPLGCGAVDPPPHAGDLAEMVAESGGGTGVSLMGMLPWVADELTDAEDIRRVRLMPLSCGWGPIAVLIHDRPRLPAPGLIEALCATWGAAIAAAAQHDGARRLGERLAEANRALADAQDQLLRQESMARLGEMAAGAAHEMNNPLAVISGRSQLLSLTLPAGSKQQSAAQLIFREAHRLSDLITALHLFAEPPQPRRQPTDLAALLDAAIKQVKSSSDCDNGVQIFLQIKQQLPSLHVDAPMIQTAVGELLGNAVAAGPRESVVVTALLEPGGAAAVVQVTDDGDGMDETTLAHAMDPFFSAKAAGRRVGMGLPRADQLVKAHGGTLSIRSKPGSGTTATITVPLDSPAG